MDIYLYKHKIFRCLHEFFEKIVNLKTTNGTTCF